MKRTLYIEAETFKGDTIFGANVPPCGYGLQHVTDLNTGKAYTIIFKGDDYYSYEENENGKAIYTF